MSEFSNQTIDIQNQLNQTDYLPDIHNQQFNKVHPNLMAVELIPYGILAPVFILINIAVIWFFEPVLWWYSTPLWGLYFLSIFYNVAYVKSLEYAIREQDITLKSGVFFKKMIIQPFTRLQHIEIKRGPLERYKGLSSLVLFSAGGALHALEIKGVLDEQAQSIKQFILEHKDLNNG